MRNVVVGVVVVVGGLAACSPGDRGATVGTNNGPPIRENKATLVRAAEIVGGTLAVGPDGNTVGISDGDHHKVWLFRATDETVMGSVDVPGIPGRIVALPNGNFAVTLRNTGQVATVTRNWSQSTRSACAEPSGLTYDPASKGLFVACGGGELMFLGDDGTTNMLARAEFPLRDVIVNGGGVQVTALRTGDVFTVANGQLSNRVSLPTVQLVGTNSTWTANTAWRTIPSPRGGWLMVHQRAFDGEDGELTPPNPTSTPSNSSTSPYGGTTTLPGGITCDSPVVRSTVTVGDTNGVGSSMEMTGVLPVDVAVSGNTTNPNNSPVVAVAFAGSMQVRVLQFDQLGGVTGGGSCELSGPSTTSTGGTVLVPGAPEGVGFTGDGRLVIHVVRNGAHVVQVSTVPGASQQSTISKFLGDEVQAEGGSARDLFHRATNEMSCASCHPMGHDDGHTWRLIAHTARTQSLAGGILATAPFHWDGKLPSVSSVMSETFVHRMGGVMPSQQAVLALGNWLDGIPSVTHVAQASPDLISRGEELFNGAAACSTCHVGVTLTNNTTVDVGTGGTFQVPSLRGVAERGPWMHDGCATTLKDRFTNPACGGAAHGNLATLTDADFDALTAYLQTL